MHAPQRVAVVGAELWLSAQCQGLFVELQRLGEAAEQVVALAQIEERLSVWCGRAERGSLECQRLFSELQRLGMPPESASRFQPADSWSGAYRGDRGRAWPSAAPASLRRARVPRRSGRHPGSRQPGVLATERIGVVRPAIRFVELPCTSRLARSLAGHRRGRRTTGPACTASGPRSAAGP